MTGSTIKFYPLDGGKPSEFYGNPPFNALAESFAMDAMPLGWEPDEDTPNDREFQAQCDRYSLVQMYDPEGYEFHVVLEDGQPIGTLDEKLTLYDISELETYDQMELREAAEEAERDAQAEYALEDRLEARRAAE